MTFELLNGNILIEPDEKGEQVDGGIYVGRQEGDKTEAVAIKGKVSEFNEDHLPEKLKGKLHVGDTVYIQKWEGQIIHHMAKKYIAIKPEHILVIVKG